MAMNSLWGARGFGWRFPIIRRVTPRHRGFAPRTSLGVRRLDPLGVRRPDAGVRTPDGVQGPDRAPGDPATGASPGPRRGDTPNPTLGSASPDPSDAYNYLGARVLVRTRATEKSKRRVDRSAVARADARFADPCIDAFDSGIDLHRLQNRLHRLQNRFFDSRIDCIDSRTDFFDSRTDCIDSRTDFFDSRTDCIDSRIDCIDSGIDCHRLQNRFASTPESIASTPESIASTPGSIFLLQKGGSPHEVTCGTCDCSSKALQSLRAPLKIPNQLLIRAEASWRRERNLRVPSCESMRTRTAGSKGRQPLVGGSPRALDRPLGRGLGLAGPASRRRTTGCGPRRPGVSSSHDGVWASQARRLVVARRGVGLDRPLGRRVGCAPHGVRATVAHAAPSALEHSVRASTDVAHSNPPLRSTASPPR